jgi:large conductance mechanosensitive channel
MLKEFREFIMRGNVVDLAIGVIIGASFTAIVNSLVNDIINPILGLLFGGQADFSNYFIPLGGQAATTLVEARASGPVLAYGAFLTAVINFLLIAFVLFLIVRFIRIIQVRSIEAQASPAPTEPTLTERLLIEIRDLLAEK